MATTHAADPVRPDAAAARAAYDAGSTFVDVRTEAEWNAGHLKAAIHLEVAQLDARAEQVLPRKEAPLVLYCASGARAQWAEQRLKAMGYTDVRAMTGGYANLKAAGYPVVE